MATELKKVYLIHGDSDYLIFKELKAIKSKLNADNASIIELFGSKNLDFQYIYSSLQSSDLFLSSSSVIIRDISDGKSFFPFVEEITNYLNSKTTTENSLYIIHSGKVLKTSKIYKAILKVGSIKEIVQPKPEETISVIKKSINISDEAAKLLLSFSGGNLFQIKNEIKKLQSYLIANLKTKIERKDVEDLCIKNLAQNEVWGIGSKFLNYKLDTTNPVNKLNLLKSIDQLMDSNVPTMQILYSFYQYTINAIKMKRMVASGKGFKECMAFGYFFVKEFFEKRDQLKLDELFEVNSKLLDYEFKMKNGEVDEIIGLRSLILSI